MLLLASAFGLAFFSPCIAHSDDTGFLPSAHDLFKPLLADPRELQYAIRAVFAVSKRPLGEAAMGDYLGIYRWALPWESSSCQISVGGGVFGRFDLGVETNDLEVVDFYANVPFDFRIRKTSLRFMLFHTSSHLGDDFIDTNGVRTAKHAWDNLRLTASYDIDPRLRLYGGATYVFRAKPEHVDRGALQAGFETFSRTWGRSQHLVTQAYWANDFQTWGRTEWSGMFNSQLGIRMRKETEATRAVSFFAEYGTGRQPQGQFYTNRETRWGLGVKLDLT